MRMGRRKKKKKINYDTFCTSGIGTIKSLLTPNCTKSSKSFVESYRDLSRHNWSPTTTGPPGPSAANYVTVDGLPGPSMAAMDGPLCCKQSPGSKPEK